MCAGVNIRTDSTQGPFAYPYWHPSGRYVAFSTNETIRYEKRGFFVPTAADLQSPNLFVGEALLEFLRLLNLHAFDSAGGGGHVHPDFMKGRAENCGTSPAILSE